MKITMDNEKEYNVSMTLSETDKNRDEGDLEYDFLALVATLIVKYQEDLQGGAASAKRKRDATFSILDSIGKMLDMYYKELIEADMYEYAQVLYEEFLAQKNWTDEQVYNVIYGKETDLETVLEGEKIRFSIIDKDNGEELIVIDEVACSKVDSEEAIPEAVFAGAVAVVIYDKMGLERPSKAEDPFWFDKQAKAIVLDMR